jgi:hypothetical protein
VNRLWEGGGADNKSPHAAAETTRVVFEKPSKRVVLRHFIVPQRRIRPAHSVMLLGFVWFDNPRTSIAPDAVLPKAST